MSDPLVYVVLLTWNNWRDTLACLASLKAMDYQNWCVVIVDNGSEDDSVERLRQAHLVAILIENGRNLGFAAGCNVGIRLAVERGADYVWLLNADTTVDSQALAEMVKSAEKDPSVGVVGSVIYEMENPKQIQAWGGGHINFWIGRSRHFRKGVSDRALDFITGASMLIPRRIPESIGLLDEGFFMYWEETDYCFRIRAAGWRLTTAPGAVIYHRGSAARSSGNDLRDAYFIESARRFFRKHGKFPSLSLWTGVGLSMLKRMLLGRWKSVFAVWPGRSANLRGRNPERV